MYKIRSAKDKMQRYKCKVCGKVQLQTYKNQAYNINDLNGWVAGLVKESCGIRNMARLLKVAINTVVKRIRQVTLAISKPRITLQPDILEVDELRTFVARKSNAYWVAYPVSRKTGEVVDFVVNKRTTSTLKVLIENLLLRQVRKIYTDNLTIYRSLIPRQFMGVGMAQPIIFRDIIRTCARI